MKAKNKIKEMIEEIEKELVDYVKKLGTGYELIDIYIDPRLYRYEF